MIANGSGAIPVVVRSVRRDGAATELFPPVPKILSESLASASVVSRSIAYNLLRAGGACVITPFTTELKK